MCGGMTHHPVDLVWQAKIREAIRRHGMDECAPRYNLSNKDDKNGGAKKE